MNFLGFYEFILKGGPGGTDAFRFSSPRVEFEFKSTLDIFLAFGAPKWAQTAPGIDLKSKEKSIFSIFLM